MSERALIVAPATPTGRSALAVVRLSGPLDPVLGTVVVPMNPGPWRSGRTRRVEVRDADGVFDDGVAVLARGPATYTGEDTLELTVHGNPWIVDRLVHACLDAGARLAEPGELTRRAVVSGRLGLIEAEAVDQVIRAATREGVEVARRALGGELGAAMSRLRDETLDQAAELEARLDQGADALVLEDDEVVTAALSALSARCRALAATAATGRRLVEGARVALVGPVNAGKSSLFNALLGRRRALVHDAPGTTRDVVEARCALDGLELTLLDTAGERATDDPVEAAGLALAQELVEDADLVVVVLRARPTGPDAAERRILARTSQRARLVVYNGVDVPGVAAAPPGALPTSAPTGDGIDDLRRALREALVDVDGPEVLRIASVRQRDLLRAVAAHLDEAVEALPVAGPAVAADLLSEAVGELDALTGADTREAVLDAVFARFCIGK